MQTDSAKNPVRVLHLEDNESDHLLVAETFRAGGLECEFAVAKTKEEFSTALRRAKYDLIISDYSLPSYDGASALAAAQELHPETPFVFFSGTIGEEVAVDSLKNGAVDYVLKQRPHRLIPAVRRALHNAAERARLQQAEEIIREQGALLDKAQDAIIVCALDRSILYWNKSAERIYGWSAAEAIGKNVRQLLFRGNPAPAIHETFKILDERGEWIGELPQFTKDGKTVIVQARAMLIRDDHDRPKSLLIINTDITERKLLEEQFLRAQRLESLGVLVSGIAHDLNNALVPIIVGVDILRTQNLSEDAESMVRTMETSARRSAEMVRQMLTFARGGESSKTIIHADQLVKEMGKIVADTFLKAIHCTVNIGKNPHSISGIPTQMHQVLMNLCINARDAMPNGGTLTLATENISLDAAAAALHPGAKRGNYLCIRVADTGTGISPEQMEKIFQPFFTTKAPGKGTGLGLSTCQTIVKSHGGFITVNSKENVGTEFKVFLPAVDVVSPEQTGISKTSLPAGKGERILVVDDEEGILAITRAALENYGYQVLTVTGGHAAIARFAENPAAINLVVIDLDMPFMDGSATAAALRKISPDVKIIIASGSEKEIGDARRLAKAHAFIEKPFSVEDLLKTVHEVLAQKN